MILLYLLLEGILLGILLVLACAFGIHGGAVGMVHLYHKDVQERCVELGLTTPERIRKRQKVFRVGGVCAYIAYVIICAYLINGARGFADGFLQMYLMLLICNLIDRFFIDELWVCHTKCWIIPGTEDLMPYITTRDKVRKWIFGIVGMAVIAAILSAVMLIFVR